MNLPVLPNPAPMSEHDWREACRLEIARFMSSQFAPPAEEPMWRWWEKNIIVPDGEFPGEYRTDMTPMVLWVSDWLQDTRVERIALHGAAQTFKTRILLNFLLWVVDQHPGTAMWVNATVDAAREFWIKRLEPAILNCAPVKARYLGKTKDVIQFESLNMLLRGTNSKVGMQGDPVKWMIFDERREWTTGAVEMLRMRTRTMSEYKEISAGTAGPAFGEFHLDFNAGSQTQGHFRCVQCGESQPFRPGREPTVFFPARRELGGIRAVDENGKLTEKLSNDFTKPNGVWNYENLKSAVRWQCQKCAQLFKDSDKYLLLKTIHPVDYNPTAPAKYRSLTWSAYQFLWAGCHWGVLTEQFLRAVEALKTPSTSEDKTKAMYTWVTETCGEPWTDRLGVIEDFGFLETRKAEYDYGDTWPEEICRFMSADKQEKGGEHYWYVIRAFGRGGKSRLVIHGNAKTKAELEQIRRDNKASWINSMIDSGFMAQEVYRFCVATKWKAFKGDPIPFYLVTVPDPKNPGKMIVVRRLWRRTLAVVYNAKTRMRAGTIPLFTFSNPGTNDLLTEYMMGLVGDWTIPRNCEKEYLRQMTGDIRKEHVDNKGVVSYEWHTVSDNHYRDCERMILTAAIISKTINAPLLVPGK